MRWNETITLTFVKLYLKHGCLWNPSHPSYKLKHKREKAYSQIIAEFKETTGKYLSMPELKTKIKNLRTTYQQTVQKILKKSRPDVIYEPSLIWFNEMDRCLKDVPCIRRSMANNQEVPDVDIKESHQWSQEHELMTKNFEENNSDPLVPPLIEVYETEETSIIQPTDMKKNKKKKYRILKLKETELKEDEFDIYGKYIASQLRSMALPKALRIQMEIQNIITGARTTTENT